MWKLKGCKGVRIMRSHRNEKTCAAQGAWRLLLILCSLTLVACGQTDSPDRPAHSGRDSSGVPVEFFQTPMPENPAPRVQDGGTTGSDDSEAPLPGRLPIFCTSIQSGNECPTKPTPIP